MDRLDQWARQNRYTEGMYDCETMFHDLVQKAHGELLCSTNWQTREQLFEMLNEAKPEQRRHCSQRPLRTSMVALPQDFGQSMAAFAAERDALMNELFFKDLGANFTTTHMINYGPMSVPVDIELKWVMHLNTNDKRREWFNGVLVPELNIIAGHAADNLQITDHRVGITIRELPVPYMPDTDDEDYWYKRITVEPRLVNVLRNLFRAGTSSPSRKSCLRHCVLVHEQFQASLISSFSYRLVYKNSGRRTDIMKCLNDAAQIVKNELELAEDGAFSIDDMNDDFCYVCREPHQNDAHGWLVKCVKKHSRHHI